MPRTAHNISSRTLPGLKTALDAWFAANTGLFIRQFQFIGADLASMQGVELSVSLMAETGGGALAAPYISTLYSAPSPKAVQELVDAAIAAAPAIWYQGPFLVNLSKARRLNDYIALLISTTDVVNGPANWTPS